MNLPLLFALLVGAPPFSFISAAAAANQLAPCRPLCRPVNETMCLEKEGCSRCHPVETSICSGYCITEDLSDKHFHNPFKNPRNPRQAYQNVCMYKDFYYRTVEIPGCPAGLDPFVTIPVALSCHCNSCTMDSSICKKLRRQPELCFSELFSYY